MAQVFFERRAEGSPGRKDFGLFKRALLEGPMGCDAAIVKISYESAGSMAFGGNLLLHNGRLASQEAQAHLREDLDPRKEFLSVAQGMLRRKFDIERDVLGTGSPYMVLKTDGQVSFIGLHCICGMGNDRTGTSSMALRTNAESVARAFNELVKDPLFAVGLPLAIFSLSQEDVSLSMIGTIAVLYDGRHYEIVIK